MESPVWTPIMSKFSMEQMIIALSARSRITSISYSFQPSTLSSTSTSWTGESSRPRRSSERISSELYASPPPVPPSVKLGRRTTGYPTSLANPSPACTLETSSDRGTSRPISVIAALKAWRSSARLIASRFAPISSTPNSSSTPASARATEAFSPVWPPTVESSA